MRRISLFILASLFIMGSIAPQQAAHALQACNALPFSEESEHILYGRPVLRVNPADAPANIDLIIRPTHEARNNGNTKFADWVAYKLEPSTIGTAHEPNFGNDLCIDPARTLEADPGNQDDYLNADRLGYMPTHLADPASFANAPNRFDFDLYSNIVPMHEALVPAWEAFDRAIRNYVERENVTAYIIAGPEYKHEMPRLPEADEAHRVPSGYWKFIIVEHIVPPPYDELDHLPYIYHGLWLDQSACHSEDNSEAEQLCREGNSDWRLNDIRFTDIEGWTRFDFLTGLENEVEWDIEQRGGSLDLEGDVSE